MPISPPEAASILHPVPASTGRLIPLRALPGLLLLATLALIAGSGRIIAPLAVQHAVDAGVAPAAVARAVSIGAVAVVCAVVCSAVLSIVVQRRLERELAGLRRRCLARIHSVPASWLNVPSADLLSRMTSDLDQVTTFVQGGGVQMLVNIAQFAVATAVMVSYSWELAMPVLLIAVVFLAVMMSLQRVIARRYEVARRELSALQGVVNEVATGAPVIQATGSAEYFTAKLDRALDRSRGSLSATLLPLHTNTSIGEIAISLMTVAVLVGGVWWARLPDPAHPRLSAGTILAMVLLVTFFIRPLQAFVQSLGESQNAWTGWRRARALAGGRPTAQAAGTGLAMAPGPIAVRLCGVSARYGSGPVVLHDVELSIAAGERVAIVGRTGSGKSTFAKLLTRQLDPAAGRIELGGLPLADIADASFAKRVVLVPQDPFLFAGTVAQNILLGDPAADADAVAAVLSELGLTEWADNLPDGIHTEVGLRGERLSVGERQLVALARTALVAPDLVILDEATSGVDPATDLALQQALAAVSSGRTGISIAHRETTVAAAQRVISFAAGRVVSDIRNQLVEQS